MGLPMYEEMNIITLNCIAKKSGISSLFRININVNETIYDLKKAIRLELGDTLANVDAIGVELWSVRVSKYETSMFEQLKNDDETVEDLLDGKKIIYSTDKIKRHFKNLDENDVHVVIQGVENWCVTCDEYIEDETALYKHKASQIHKNASARPPKNDDSGELDLTEEGEYNLTGDRNGPFDPDY